MFSQLIDQLKDFKLKMTHKLIVLMFGSRKIFNQSNISKMNPLVMKKAHLIKNIFKTLMYIVDK